MFTGIVETTGCLRVVVPHASSTTLVIEAPDVLNDCHTGDSIAVNGVCLTVTAFDATTFTVEIIPETVRLTNLGMLTPKSLVNLERALPLSGRLGGHFVQGHVDACVEVIRYAQHQHDVVLTLSLPRDLTQYIVKKGYVTLDGMSLTVTVVGDQQFSVALIPHTLNATIAKTYQMGRYVNLEVDILGKYLEQQLKVARMPFQ